MLNETHMIMDDLLARWHHWQSGAKVGRGYPSRAMGCGEYRASRQYDDSNGALDEDLESTTMRAIDFQVSEMKDPHRSAIYCLARSLAVGAGVFISPRLPQCRLERARLTGEARDILQNRLTNAGIM